MQKSEKIINKFHEKAIEVSKHNSKIIEGRPILVFNSSTRITTISQNAGFSLITSWCLRVAGYRVINVVCKYGTNCLFNVERNKNICDRCFNLSEKIYAGAETEFIYGENNDVRKKRFDILSEFSLNDLFHFSPNELPLGQIVLPSVRWILRRHNLTEDEETTHIYRKYLLSAWYLEEWVKELYKKNKPFAVVVFNGTFYSEAIFRLIAIKNHVRVITHEVGNKPMSAFFTEGLATEYPINIPKGYTLSEEQNNILLDFVDKRKRGDFKTAGIKFWPKVKHLSSEIKNKTNQYEQCVTIFTNVVFDTSQTNVNTLYSNMYDWLDDVVMFIKKYNNTLFIIRAHPDEDRPGKVSKESVKDWYIKRNLYSFHNLIFIEPRNFISSYELIDISKFILVYNSTIGLEASILGKPVLCAAKSRYTSSNTVIYPSSKNEYQQLLSKFITSSISVNQIQQINSLNFLYLQTFVHSLPFEQYLYPIENSPGHVGLKDFSINDLKSHLANVLVNGIVHGENFTYEQKED